MPASLPARALSLSEASAVSAMIGTRFDLPPHPLPISRDLSRPSPASDIHQDDIVIRVAECSSGFLPVGCGVELFETEFPSMFLPAVG